MTFSSSQFNGAPQPVSARGLAAASATVAASWRASRISRFATFIIFISAALVLSSSEIANKATNPHLLDSRLGDNNIAKIDGGETFEEWLNALPSLLAVDPRLTDLFKLFMMRYRRLYLYSSEMVHRAKLFVSNTLLAERLESQNPLARFGITPFSDLSSDEFVTWTGISKFKPSVSAYVGVDSANSNHNRKLHETNARMRELDRQGSPDRLLDLAAFAPINVTSPVRIQGAWDAGIAHAATAVVETAVALKINKLITLSVQQLMDCGNVSTIPDALMFVAHNGLVEEFEHPYLQHQSNCSDVPKMAHYGRGIKFHKVDPTEEALQRAVQQFGSAAVILPVCSELWQHYQGGILTVDCPMNSAVGSLAVQVTGWGQVQGAQGDVHRYWNIRTPLGTLFGEKGYMRLALGRNLWDITRHAYVAEL